MFVAVMDQLAGNSDAELLERDGAVEPVLDASVPPLPHHLGERIDTRRREPRRRDGRCLVCQRHGQILPRRSLKSARLSARTGGDAVVAAVDLRQVRVQTFRCGNDRDPMAISEHLWPSRPVHRDRPPPTSRMTLRILGCGEKEDSPKSSVERWEVTCG